MGEQRIRIEMQGKTYGHLYCLSFSHLDRKKSAHWLFRCDCGKVKEADGVSVRSGKIISCGHVKTTRGAANQYKHGHAGRGTHTATYRCWRNMLTRCYDVKSERWKNYGGRGIIVCREWFSFENFLHDLGEKPKGLTIERRDVHGNYEPANCCWATWAEQMRNTTRSKKNRI